MERFVAAHIHQPQNQRFGFEGSRDVLIGRQLFGLVRRRLSIEKQKLGAQQTAAFGAVGDGRRGIERIPQIGEYLDAGAVERAALRLCFGPRLASPREPRCDRGSRGVDGGWGRRRLQRARVGVNDHGSAVRDLTDAAANADEHGNLHGGRQYGNVRRSAAAAQANGDQSMPVEGGQFRGQQIIGDQHGLLGQRESHRPRFAGERQQHMRFHVEQIIGAFAQA